MKEFRSASQILFGFLPEQTVDIGGGVWKVKKWQDAKIERAADVGSLRRELCRLAGPWRATENDGGFVVDLERNTSLVVRSLNRDSGVQVEPFPRIWMCKKCRRLHHTPDGVCRCGYSGIKGQLPFVGYHDACGSLRQPTIPRCREHNEVKIVFPGTATATEIKFVCPICERQIQKGLGFARCDCGKGNLTFNVHRASSVYTPRSVVLVNPPSAEKLRTIVEGGGPAQALSWVVEGMTTLSMDQAGPTAETLRRQLKEQGFSETLVERMITSALETGELRSSAPVVTLPDAQRVATEVEAVTIVLATLESRLRVEDLAEGTDSLTELGSLYRDKYPLAVEEAGLEAIELIDKFPVLTGQFGYTRGSSLPGESRLRAFRERSGEYVVYADIAETEALFIRLSPMKVAQWCGKQGLSLDPYVDDRSARMSILKSAVVPDAGADVHVSTVGSAVLKLVHSYAHRFIRLAAVHAGIERNALAELLVPLHLGFYVYAAARGDFVLGGLQAVFEGELDRLLESLVHDEHRCALDPGCSAGGGACVACLHLGEPSCRYFNRFLGRKTLTGLQGFLSL